MSTLLSDIRYALRQFSAQPGFAFTAVASLALGLGANATIFSVGNTLLLQPLDVPRSGSVVRVYSGHHSPFNFPAYAEMKEHSHRLSHLVAETTIAATLDGESGPQRIDVGLTSGNLFSALGPTPSLGQFFARSDDRSPAASPEVVIAYAFWTASLGGDSTVIGRTLTINGSRFVVRGVAPPSFRSSQIGWSHDVFIPIGDSKALMGIPPDSLGGMLYVSGRLAAGATTAQAESELTGLARERARLLGDDPDRVTVRVKPARGITEEVRTPAAVALGFLLTITLLVLVIAATNVGNVILAQHAARTREFGIRIALGASRGQLVRQMLVESGLLAIAGGVLALIVAAWTSGLIMRLVPADTEVSFVFVIDWRVMAFTGLVAVGAMLICGLTPALHASRQDVIATIRSNQAGTGVARSRLRQRFLLAQVTLSTVLLATAMLFARSLANARVIDAGFPTANLLDARLDLGGRHLSDDQVADFYDRLTAGLRQLPGVKGATVASIAPLTFSNSETTLFIEGRSAPASGTGSMSTYFNVVGPGYYQVMGIPLLQGREFTDGDRRGAPEVAIVNETFAARFWPGESPIGRRISLTAETGPWIEVVGVSRNIRYHTLGEDPPLFLTVPYRQLAMQRMIAHVRIGDAASATEVTRRVTQLVHTLDASLPPPPVSPLTTDQQVVLVPARLGAILLGLFGGLAALLSAVGIAGVAGFSVAQRTREIGLRSALGARPSALLRAVLADTLRVVVTGGAVGIVLALGVSKLLGSVLYGVPLFDPVTFTMVPVGLALIATVAAVVPARRALRIDPADALRA